MTNTIVTLTSGNTDAVTLVKDEAKNLKAAVTRSVNAADSIWLYLITLSIAIQAGVTGAKDALHNATVGDDGEPRTGDASRKVQSLAGHAARLATATGYLPGGAGGTMGDRTPEQAAVLDAAFSDIRGRRFHGGEVDAWIQHLAEGGTDDHETFRDALRAAKRAANKDDKGADGGEGGADEGDERVPAIASDGAVNGALVRAYIVRLTQVAATGDEAAMSEATALADLLYAFTSADDEATV